MQVNVSKAMTLLLFFCCVSHPNCEVYTPCIAFSSFTCLSIMQSQQKRIFNTQKLSTDWTAAFSHFQHSVHCETYTHEYLSCRTCPFFLLVHSLLFFCSPLFSLRASLSYAGNGTFSASGGRTMLTNWVAIRDGDGDGEEHDFIPFSVPNVQ